MKYGILGAGRIAPVYLELARDFPELDCVAIADTSLDAATAMAARFGGRGCSMDDMLADPGIDVIANLTPIPAHDVTSRAILAAGKHLYSEKPVASSVAVARELQAIARDKNLIVAVAPDTVFGAAHRLARHLIDSGAIGRPVSAAAHFMMDGALFSSRFFGGAIGPLRELGPYYLTALVHLLGPVRAIATFADCLVPERQFDGVPFAVPTPTTLNAALSFASGAQGSLTVSVDGVTHTRSPIEIYGTEGTLLVPDPNFFGGSVTLLRRDGTQTVFETDTLPLGAPNWKDGTLANYRSVGLADMAVALRTGTRPRASLDVAIHVLEIIETMIGAGPGGVLRRLTTDCRRPDSLPDAGATALLGGAV